jgi:hypothetical protein
VSDAKIANARLTAVERLADVLAEENAALKRLDFSALVALVGAKETALANLTAPPAVPGLRTKLALRLMTLAAENQILLEHAITVQIRVVWIIARAAAPAPAATRYNEYGRPTNAQRTGALALSTRA